MEVIQLLDNTNIQLPPLALTIGNFDGVHIGHQQILKQLRCIAQKHELKTAVMFFEPQPREFFSPDNPLPRISSADEKLALLASMEVDYALVAAFDDAFRSQSAHAFAERLRGLNVRHVLIGDDFRFGHDRTGDSAFLRAANFAVDEIDTVSLHDERISSTRIRACLAKGDFAAVAKLLGRPYSITGNVVHGDHIGAGLDFPTANVALNRPKPCLHGIYAAEVVCEDVPLADLAQGGATGVAGFGTGSLFAAVHVGTRPAIQDKPAEWRLEVHLPKFSGDLYGRRLKVTFLYFLHEERYYSDLEALKAGIRGDVEELLVWREQH